MSSPGRGYTYIYKEGTIIGDRCSGGPPLRGGGGCDTYPAWGVEGYDAYPAGGGGVDSKEISK